MVSRKNSHAPSGNSTRSFVAPPGSRKTGWPVASSCQVSPSCEPSTRTALMNSVAGDSRLTAASGWVVPVSSVSFVPSASIALRNSFGRKLDSGRGAGRSMRYGTSLPVASSDAQVFEMASRAIQRCGGKIHADQARRGTSSAWPCAIRSASSASDVAVSSARARRRLRACKADGGCGWVFMVFSVWRGSVDTGTTRTSR